MAAWDNGLLEGIMLAGARGWMPPDKNLSCARFKGAHLSGFDDLSGFDFSGLDFSHADLRHVDFSNASLCVGVIWRGRMEVTQQVWTCSMSAASTSTRRMGGAACRMTSKLASLLCLLLLSWQASCVCSCSRPCPRPGPQSRQHERQEHARPHCHLRLP